MIFDFEYEIMCILDFGRDFMSSKPRVYLGIDHNPRFK